MISHLAKKPMPPNTGNPSRASMNTLIATASHGRISHSPAKSSSVSLRSPSCPRAMITPNAPIVASVYAST
jgi:hypothetical protein